MIRAVVPAALFALFVGCTCSKVEEPSASQTNLTPTPPSAKRTVDPGPEPQVDLDSLPSEEQYELEAEKAITPENLLHKVNELDEEVAFKK